MYGEPIEQLNIHPDFNTGSAKGYVRTKDSQTYYWFRGIKTTLNIIKDMCGWSTYQIKKGAERDNLTIQEFLYTIENSNVFRN